MADKSIRVRRRLDFIVEPEIIDKEQGIIGLRFIPNPKRYEWMDRKDGKRDLYDKLDQFIIPYEAIEQLTKEINGLPFYHEPQEIENADEYVRSRIPEIIKMLEDGKMEVTFSDKSEEFLESLNVDKLGFAIMSIDLVGSTKLSQQLNQKNYAKLIQIFTYELSSIIPKFRGHVLKYTGDGMIAYFPEPNFITKCDLALDCGLTIRKLVYNGLNPLFIKYGLKQIDMRVGLDAGDASILILGNPKTKQHKDIIGSVISIAAKIQSHAGPGGVCIGDTMQRNLHTDWKLHCKKVDISNDWPYKDEHGKPYMVYRFE